MRFRIAMTYVETGSDPEANCIDAAFRADAAARPGQALEETAPESRLSRLPPLFRNAAETPVSAD